jgi:hypothetical protein
VETPVGFLDLRFHAVKPSENAKLYYARSPKIIKQQQAETEAVRERVNNVEENTLPDGRICASLSIKFHR